LTPKGKTPETKSQREMNEASAALHESIETKKKMILLEIGIYKRNRHVDLKGKAKVQISDKNKKKKN
jgi:hypothetical protein